MLMRTGNPKAVLLGLCVVGIFVLFEACRRAIARFRQRERLQAKKEGR